MSQAPAPAKPEGRAAHVISQIYYYVAAVIGFGLFLGGAIGALFGVRELVLPREFDSVRGGVRTILHGLSVALPGIALIWWHLRQASSREDRPTTSAFWGRSLYFHLMALVALGFVLIGGIGVLFNLGDAALGCEGSPEHAYFTTEHPPPEGYGTFVEPGTMQVEFCHPSREEALRNAVDSAIFLIVAAPVFWWHLRQGRRLTAPDET